MKKLIALTSAFILAAVSCSAKNTEIEPVRNENGKYVVTVGSFERVPFIDDTARHPDDIELQFVDFSEGYNIDPHDEQQRNAMHMEIDKRFAKGDVPDVLILSVDDVKRLDKLGAFADMSVLMDEYDCGIKREELTDVALEGLTVDGRIPALIKGYSFVLYAAKTKFVPREYTNWNADAAMKFYKEMPEGMLFCSYHGDGTAPASVMLEFEALNCVDEKNGTCDFSGKFAELLQFCCDNPSETVAFKGLQDMTLEEREMFYRDESTKNMRDDILVYSFDYGYAAPQAIYNDFFGQELTFVGQPSEDDVRHIFSCGDLYCITEKCANKKAAWELVSQMIRTNYTSQGTLTTQVFNTSIFKKYQKNDYDKYVESLDKEKIKEWGVIPKDYFDYIMDYYNSTPAKIYTNYDLLWLIWEEYLPALKGEQSVEDTIKILNNKVGTYLNERT